MSKCVKPFWKAYHIHCPITRIIAQTTFILFREKCHFLYLNSAQPTPPFSQYAAPIRSTRVLPIQHFPNSRMKNLSAPRAFTHPIIRAFISLFFFSLSLLAFYSQSIIPEKKTHSRPRVCFPTIFIYGEGLQLCETRWQIFVIWLKFFLRPFQKTKKAEQRAREALDKIVCVYRGK